VCDGVVLVTLGRVVCGGAAEFILAQVHKPIQVPVRCRGASGYSWCGDGDGGDGGSGSGGDGDVGGCDGGDCGGGDGDVWVGESDSRIFDAGNVSIYIYALL